MITYNKKNKPFLIFFCLLSSFFTYSKALSNSQALARFSCKRNSTNQKFRGLQNYMPYFAGLKKFQKPLHPKCNLGNQNWKTMKNVHQKPKINKQN